MQISFVSNVKSRTQPRTLHNATSDRKRRGLNSGKNDILGSSSKEVNNPSEDGGRK